MIDEIRILPPLVIGRLGGAPTPMDNYDVDPDPEHPLGHRLLRPAPTLRIDPATGAVAAEVTPDEVRFTENGRVRPVAPFLEVWTRVDGGDLEPLTTAILTAHGLAVADVRWRVVVANHKAARRTGDPADRITADTGEFTGHARHPMDGRADNFWPGATIPFGWALAVRPTDAFPQIRLRVMPAAGLVYGSSGTAPDGGPPADPNLTAVVYDGSRGSWDTHQDGRPNTPSPTSPGFIYARNGRISRGYLDDACDGEIRVALDTPGGTRTSLARIGIGPPTYGPQALPIRSLRHELEQALLGPAVADADADPAVVEEIVRRAFETVRLLHGPSMNSGGMAGHDENEENRRAGPIASEVLVDTAALETLHESLLVALRSGTAPWFADALRGHDEVGDLTDEGRRKMPAMMRGADGRHLALSRRQVELVRALVRGPVFPEENP